MPTHPRCLLCGVDAPCPFHAATTAAELAKAAATALRERGSVGLADLFVAAFARIEDGIPPQVAAVLGRLGTDALYARFAELLEQDGFSAEDLRELAALSLALAVVSEHREDVATKPAKPAKPGARRRAHP